MNNKFKRAHQDTHNNNNNNNNNNKHALERHFLVLKIFGSVSEHNSINKHVSSTRKLKRYFQERHMIQSI